MDLQGKDIEVFVSDLKEKITSKRILVSAPWNFDPFLLFEGRESLTKNDMEVLADFLIQHEIGMEPDIAHYFTKINLTDPIVLFKSSCRLGKSSQAFIATRKLLRLGVMVITCDHDVDHSEVENLASMVERTIELNSDEKIRLNALTKRLCIKIPDPFSLEAAVKINLRNSLTETQIIELVQKLILADHKIMKSELSFLKKVYGFLEMDTLHIKRDLINYAKKEKIPYVDESSRIKNTSGPVNSSNIDELIIDDLLSEFGF